MVETGGSSEILLPIYKPTRSHIQEDRNLPRTCDTQNAFINQLNGDLSVTE